MSWSNKDIELGFQKSPTNLYNGSVSNGDGVLTLNPSPTVQLVMEMVPLLSKTFLQLK